MDQAAELQKLRHQHAQLLAFNHVLVEENNHRLVDHAELVSEVMLGAVNIISVMLSASVSLCVSICVCVY